MELPTDTQLEERALKLTSIAFETGIIELENRRGFYFATLDRLRDARESLRLLEKTRSIMEARGYPTLDIDTHIDHLKKLLGQ